MSKEAQLSRLRGLLSHLKLWDEKNNLVLDASNGRTTHSSELTFKELLFLNNHLQLKLNAFMPLKEDRVSKMIKKIYSICHDIGWETPEGKVDTAHLAEFLLKYGYLHKPLKDYTEMELPKLVTQFENIQRKHYGKP